MSDYKNDITSLLFKILGLENFVPVKSFDATVTSVDEPSRTCIVNSEKDNIDGMQVRLMPSISDGILLVPSIGETVTVVSGGLEPYISHFSWIDKLTEIVGNQGRSNDGTTQVFNDGAYGGLTKTKELKTQLDKTNDTLNAILTILTGTPINEPGNGSPSALQAALNTSLVGKQLGDYSQIENTSITHGQNLPDA